MSFNPGTDDLISHTLKHFLCPSEEWAEWPSDDAAGPEEHLAALQSKGYAVERFWATARGRAALPDSSWWQEPKVAMVRAAHDRGYWPRYAELASRAGDPAGEQSAWIRKANGHVVADILGVRLVASPRRHSRVYMVSAFRRGEHTEATSLGALGDKLRGWCQRQRRGASTGQESSAGDKP